MGVSYYGTYYNRRVGFGIFYLVAMIAALLTVNKCNHDNWKATLAAIFVPHGYLIYHYIWRKYVEKAPDLCPKYVKVAS